jgi:hypothetical protein
MAKSIFGGGKDDKKPQAPIPNPNPTTEPEASELEPWEIGLQDDPAIGPPNVSNPASAPTVIAPKPNGKKPKAEGETKPITKVPGPRRKFE